MKVVASFLGRRNYNRYEIEAAVGAPLARQLKVDLVEGSEEEADCVLRIHLRDHTAILALRLFQEAFAATVIQDCAFAGRYPSTGWQGSCNSGEFAS